MGVQVVKDLLKVVFCSRRQNIIFAFCAMLLSASAVFVLPVWYRTNINQYTDGGIGTITALLQFVGLAAVFFICLSLLVSLSPGFLRWLDRFEPLRFLAISWDKRSFLINFVILFVCYLPWLILLFPGGMSYDAVAQVLQIEGSGALRPEVYEGTPQGLISDTHPILHTVILAVFFKLGLLFGSQNLGLFLYCLFQSAVNAACFSVACCYLNRLSAPKLLRIASLAFFALFPAIASSTALIFKDYLYSPLFVLYLIAVTEIVLTKAACLTRRRNLIAFIAICLLLACMKKTGLHVILLVGIVLLVVYRKHFKGLLLANLIPIFILSVVYPFLLFPALQVIPGGFQEVMGPLLQQTARVVSLKGSEIPKSEREAIDKVVPYLELDRLYQYWITDHVKGNYHQRATTSDLLAYLSVWASQGMRYPQLYVEATLNVEAPFLVPYVGWGIEYNLPPRNHKFWIDWVARQERYRNNNVKYLADKLDFGSVVELYPAKQAVYDVVTNLSKTPVVFLFFSMGFYILWIPSISFSTLLRYRPREALAFLPVLVSFLILMLSPAALSRYGMPLLEIAPLLVGLAVFACRCPQSPALAVSYKLSFAGLFAGKKKSSGLEAANAQLAPDATEATNAQLTPDTPTSLIAQAKQTNSSNGE